MILRKRVLKSGQQEAAVRARLEAIVNRVVDFIPGWRKVFGRGSRAGNGRIPAAHCGDEQYAILGAGLGPDVGRLYSGRVLA